MHSSPRRRRHSRAPLHLALAALCLLLVAACTVGPSRRPPLATAGALGPTGSDAPAPSTMPTGPGGPGRTADPLEWTACPDAVSDTAADGTRFTVDCAGLPVPVSYTDSGAGSLTIRVARARTPNTPADAPPLLVLGDPGTRGRSAVAEVAASLPTAVREHYTIITLDVRGTGYSDGIDCISDSAMRTVVGMAADPTTTRGAAELTALARQLTFDCGDLVGSTLTDFNSSNAADDLDTLRAALGVPGIALLGRGYGATIGAVYADRYPGRVRALVLDSPDDPLATPDHRATTAAAAAQSLLTDFAAACPGFDGGCPLGDHPIRAITDLVRSLPAAGERAGDWHITDGSVLLALLRVLPDQQSWSNLATALARLRDHDPERLADLLTAALGGTDLSEQLTAALVYRCNDTAARLTGRQINHAVAAASAESALFGPFTVAQAGWCSSWPAPDDALGRLTATGAPPILVIGSVKNPLHPYAGVQSLAAQLSSAVLLSWQSGSNGAYPTNACVTAAVDAYLLRGTVPQMGVLCPP